LPKLSQETKNTRFWSADLKFMFNSEFDATIACHTNINNKARQKQAKQT